MKMRVTLEDILVAESREEDLLRAFIIDQPRSVVACLRLGSILREKGDYKNALKLHRSLLIRPDVSLDLKKKIYRNIVEDYIKADKLGLALSFAKDLQKLDPKDISSLDLLYFLYEELSQWDEVIDVKKKILRLKGQSDNKGLAILYAISGDSLIKSGNKRDGVKRLQEALKLDNLCLPALLFIGDFYYEGGDVDKGIELWKKVLDNLPDYSFLVFNRLEKAYYETKHDFSELESLYISFLERNPGNVRTLIELSEIYEKRGEDAEAIESLKKAEEIEPQNLVVKKKLFKLYYDNKRYSEMFKDGNKIIEFATVAKSFKCYKCSNNFVEFKFRCPNCKSWLTIR
ncbi:MAG: tetratricopeptide repeat protein [bacterium]|nr:tetratricopeptide repeat protein [bacterium]